MAHACKIIAPAPAGNAPERCPLCAGPNDCQLCSTAAYKGPCWCAKVDFPEALLARVPAEQRNRACICRCCVESFHRNPASPDHYFDAGGLMVFTEAYLLRRGYCCGNNCRHCPYQKQEVAP